MSDAPSPPPPASADDGPATAEAAQKQARRKTLPSLIAAAVLVVALLVYMFTFVNPYRSVTVLTTFENLTEDSLVAEPGLHARWPWPIQQAYTYDLRLRSLEVDLAELGTADDKQVVAAVSATWRIDDPIAFFNRLRSEEEAVSTLQRLLQSTAKTVIGSTPLVDLVGVDGSSARIGDVQDAMQRQLNATLAGNATATAPASGGGFGITVDRVAVTYLGFSEAVAKATIDTQRAEKRSIADRLEEEGKTRALTIRNEADAMAERITTFAETYRARLLAEADRYVATTYPQSEAARELSELLRRVDLFKNVLAENSFFIIDNTSFYGTFSDLLAAIRGNASPPPVPEAVPARRAASAPTPTPSAPTREALEAALNEIDGPAPTPTPRRPLPRPTPSLDELIDAVDDPPALEGGP